MAGPSPAEARKFRKQILTWYDSHARDLPWRKTSDPYRIWVSEIMLQQTRVNAVIDYYSRFLALFPTVNALAEASESAVLAAWSGLGYYRRARMMHQAAKVVVAEHNGIFPSTAAELRSLPGIGEYTSSAIASIAFQQPVATVDGNVERVLLRVFPGEQTGAKWLQSKAASLVDPQRPGDFNQAMMELGATTCLPQRPLCLQCAVHRFCATRGEHPTTPAKKMHSRQIAYALCSHGGKVLLEQRPQSASLMPGMWELPEIEITPGGHERIELTLRHAITVTNYRVHVLRYSEEETRSLPSPHPRKWTRTSDLGKLPLTGLTRKILRRLQIMHEVQ
jgi:A/G-specific adenine glycosylase